MTAQKISLKRKATKQEYDELEKTLSQIKKIINKTPYCYPCEREVFNWEENRDAVETIRKIINRKGMQE